MSNPGVGAYPQPWLAYAGLGEVVGGWYVGGCLVGACLEVGGGGRGAAGEGEQQQEDDEACVPGNIDYYEKQDHWR